MAANPIPFDQIGLEMGALESSGTPPVVSHLSSLAARVPVGQEREDRKKSKSFVTLIIRMSWSEKLPDDDVLSWVENIGASLAKHKGFISRKVLDVGQPLQGRKVVAMKKQVVICKFCGIDSLLQWQKGQTLADHLVEGASMGLVFERELRTRLGGYLDLSALHISAAGGGGTISPTQPNKDDPGFTNLSPPKYMMAVLIWAWVFPTVLLHTYLEVSAGIDTAIGGNRPFTLLLSLFVTVPVISYAAVPLTLALPWVQWCFHRTRPPPQCEPFRTLDVGLGLFSLPPPPPPLSAEAIARIEQLERHVMGLRKAAANDRASLRSYVLADDDVRPSGSSPTLDRSSSDNDMETGEDDEIAIAARHHIQWAYRDDFRGWCDEMADAMLQHGGFLGSDVFHDDAEETSDNSEFVVLFRFSSFWGMESWLASEERAHMLRRLEPMLSQPSTYREPTGQRYARSPGAITPAKDLFSDLVGPQVIFSSSLSLPLLSSSPSR
jgi:antibiotic biosynthesis monooxygenase (ABM) superfamily enzyme